MSAAARASKSAYVNRAVARKSTGDADEAIADCNRALEIKPDIAEAYNNRGTAKDMKGDVDGAIADYSKAIELDPAYVSAYSNRGTAWCSKNRFDEAIEDYTKAINLEPGEAALYTNRGTAKSEKKLHEEAIADHTKAIELAPDLAVAYANRGGSKRDMGLLRPAMEDLEAALKRAPKNWPNRPVIERLLRAIEQRALYLEGEALFDGGKYREAIRKYAEIVERWPGSGSAPSSAYNCACGYALLGEKSTALDWLEKAIEVGWKDADHLEEDPDLDSLRDDERYKKLVAKLNDR